MSLIGTLKNAIDNGRDERRFRNREVVDKIQKVREIEPTHDVGWSALKQWEQIC